MSLHAFRMSHLSAPVPQGWNAELKSEEASGEWIDAIKDCYDTLTSARSGLDFFDRKTELIVRALKSDGTFNDRGRITTMSSSEDPRAPVKERGTKQCAERKFLDNGFLEAHEKEIGKQKIWLFYLSRSPCTVCSKTLVKALDDKKIEHLVIAFESFYRERDANGRSEAADALLAKLVDGYQSGRPGIELFKLHRDEADKIAMQTAEQTLLGSGVRHSTRLVHDMQIKVGDSSTVVPSRRRNDIGEGGFDAHRRDLTEIVPADDDESEGLTLLSGKMMDRPAATDPTLRVCRVARNG